VTRLAFLLADGSRQSARSGRAVVYASSGIPAGQYMRLGLSKAQSGEIHKSY
jgi:hypothetical protein